MSILLDMKMEQHFIISIAEHQTLISWNDDAQNELFQEWLWAEGFNAFEEYVEKEMK